MKIEKVLENIKKLEITEELENDIICAFEDYEFKGAKEVIVSKDEINDNIDYQAYVDHVDVPIICIKIKQNKIIS